MPGWRLPSNMPPDDVRGLPRRRRSRAWLVALALLVVASIVIGWQSRAELGRLFAWTAAQRKAWTIAGRVVDARTGRPLPGAWVRVGSTAGRYLALRPLPTPVWTTVRTGEDGAFRVQTHLLGEPILYFQCPGYEDAVLQPATTTDIVQGLSPVASRSPTR